MSLDRQPPPAQHSPSANELRVIAASVIAAANMTAASERPLGAIHRARR